MPAFFLRAKKTALLDLSVFRDAPLAPRCYRESNACRMKF